MYIAKRYETDSGLILAYAVAIYISYNGRRERQLVNFALPDLLLLELQPISQYCATKQIIPRSVLLILTSGDTLQIGCPFRPGTANWLAFQNQLQQLPDVADLKSFGEKVTDKFLRSLLGIV